MKPLYSLAATARVANIPSVMSNVWLGVVLGSCERRFDETALHLTLLLSASAVSLYLSGNFLNDCADRDWDAVHRPERALPSGLFRPGFYLACAIAFGCLGLVFAALVNVWSLGIAVAICLAILVYTGIHKRTIVSVIPMGLCRALLPILGYFGIAGTHTITPQIVVLAGCAFGLFCHIVGLSLSARAESVRTLASKSIQPSAMWFLLAAISLCASAFYFGLPPSFCALGVLPYALWIALSLTVFRVSVPVHVSNLLAGIPLVDWMLLWPIFLMSGAFSASSEPFYLACFWVSPLAFFAGKSLQRLAPAT
ncbi:MAG: UbiA family prenyltransferase [Gloeobacteraceae cyanobacterium ES-bin-144]|nr:UbiA family prenyltransferase [Verrucomicrobiales bacterium]